MDDNTSTYSDFAVREAIASLASETLYDAPIAHTPVRKALGMSVHQGVEHHGASGAIYYKPLCGVDSDRAQFSTHRYREVDQLLTCSKCIAIVNG